MKSKAAVLRKPGEVEVTELAVPDPGRGQVLVHMKASGICRSNLMEVDGLRGLDSWLPHTLGHEGAGVVEEVGLDVTRVGKGDHVVVSWIRGEGLEAPATYGSDQGRVNGGPANTLLEYALVAENRITAIDKSLPFTKAALLGCAVPTGAGAVWKVARPKPKEVVAVFGCGGVGMAAIRAADINLATVIAVDVDERKLEKAASLGADFTIKISDPDFMRWITEWTKGRLVDCAIEASGQGGAMEAALSCTRLGGTCILAGNLLHGEKITIDPYDLILGKQLVGTWGGETMPGRDIPVYAGIEYKLRLGDMIHKPVYSLDQVNQAFDDLRRGNVIGRAVVEFD